MKKERNPYGHLSLNNSCFCGSLFLLLLLVTACKSNQIMIDSNEVKSIHFWFVHPNILYNVSQLDCADMVFTDDNHDTIITDRKTIERYVAIINSLKPINPKSVYDVRATSLICMQQMNGRRKKMCKLVLIPYGEGYF